jgi:hypothetical protein
MGMFQTQGVPNTPAAPPVYDQSFMNTFSNVLRLFYNNINAVQHVNIASLNLDLKTLPTEAALATIRVGDVYRDTTADNALKVKV